MVAALDPFQTRALSQDGRYALVQVQFAAVNDKVTQAQRDAYEATGAAARSAGLRVEHGGEVIKGEPQVSEPPPASGDNISFLAPPVSKKK